jgi:hypothetical protein
MGCAVADNHTLPWPARPAVAPSLDDGSEQPCRAGCWGRSSRTSTAPTIPAASAAGLDEVSVAPVSSVFTDLALADPLLHLSAAAEGRFMAGLTGFMAGGRRP